MSTHAIILQQSTDELLRIDGTGAGHVAVCGKALKRFVERLDGERAVQMLSFCAQFCDSRSFECDGPAIIIMDVLMLINRDAMLMFRAESGKQHRPTYVYRVDVLFRHVIIELFVHDSRFAKTFTFTEFSEMSVHVLHAAVERLRADVANDTVLYRYIELITLEEQHARAHREMQQRRDVSSGHS